MSKDVLMCRRCQEHEESAWKAGGARNAQMIGASYVLSLPWKTYEQAANTAGTQSF